jgi:uncharacterized membrane protein
MALVHSDFLSQKIDGAGGLGEHRVMTKTWIFALTLAAAIGSGVMAGLFFTFSNFVMPALARVAPPRGIAAMQSINITVQNPLFFLVFFGTALVSLALIVVCFPRWSAPGMALALASGLLYLAGSLAVTALVNVPLNNALAPLDPQSAEAAAFWADYVTRWTWWNHVRSVACILAMLGFVLALTQLKASA